jgi:AraC family transcriptional regulator of adaptative response / DNA-3-methyladenine glycosylase II
VEHVELEEERCWRAVQSRDPRFDGWFYSAVVTTGIYCRPSCPARPHRVNLRFFRSAAAAQAAGFRACKRCRPDAVPGSPEWNARGDIVARAMRLIADGVVDREGVDGLAKRLGYTTRHVHRMLTEELGAGPQALARAQRAHTARLLLETTSLKMAEVAFAAGFASVRQFNDTVREIYALTPTQVRGPGLDRERRPAGTLTLRLPYRRPLHAGAALGFLAQRAVAGVESCDGAGYERSLALPHGHAVVRLAPTGDHVTATLRLDDVRDLATAVHRARRLLDLDADPVAIDEQLGADPTLSRLVADSPGLRVPGYADPAESAIRAVIGQQVSVAGARTTTARLVTTLGAPLVNPDGGITHAFPTVEALAGVDPDSLPMPRSRGRALHGLAAALADGRICLDPGADRTEAAHRLLALPGIGPWTAAYVALRGLGDPDTFLSTDLGIRRALERLGRPTAAPAVEALSEHWRPWRSYAVMHLWQSLHDLARTPIGAVPA